MSVSVPGGCQVPPPPTFKGPLPGRKEPEPGCGFIAERVHELVKAAHGADLLALETAEAILRGTQTDPKVMRGTVEALRGMLEEDGFSRRTRNTLLLAIARITGWLVLGGP